MIAPLPVRGKNLLTRLRSFCDHEHSHERPEGAGRLVDAGRDSSRSRREPSASFTLCRIVIRLAALSTIFLLPHHPSAGAGSAVATVNVSATVTRKCGLSTVVSNPLGPADSATKPVGNARLTITCSKGAGQTIAIDTDGKATTINDIRALSNGVGTLNFDVKKEVFMLVVNF